MVRAGPNGDARAAGPGSVMHMLFGFEGRMQRGTYRLMRIVSYVVLLALIWSFAGLLQRSLEDPSVLLGVTLASVAVMVVYFWTTLAMQVKRWHDRDKSGVWLFVGLIPFVGPLWVLVEMAFLEGTVGPNQFGPSPKGDPTTVFEA